MRAEKVDAPYVAEFPLALECRLFQTHELGLHTQYVGEVLEVHADEDVLTEDGKVDIERLRPIIFSPGPTVYHRVGPKLGDGYCNRELGR